MAGELQKYTHLIDDDQWKSRLEQAGIENYVQLANMRDELWSAYDRYLGRVAQVSAPRLPGDNSTGLYCTLAYENPDEAATVRSYLSEKVVIPSPVDVKKYSVHGIATFKVTLSPRHCITIDGPVIIDMASLCEPKPEYIWLKGMEKERLEITVSSGKQQYPDNFGVIDLESALEGLALIFNYETNPKGQMRYRPCLIYLYSDKKPAQNFTL